MRKTLLAVAALVSVVLAAPLAKADVTKDDGAPSINQKQGVSLMSEEHRAKLREEIRLNRQRAQELEPIIARDRQARHDVEVNWIVLERHGRELHARANDFRTWASLYQGRAHDDLGKFATELDTYGTHDEENARVQHEIGERLDRLVVNETAARDWHNQVAQRLEQALRDWQ